MVAAVKDSRVFTVASTTKGDASSALLFNAASKTRDTTQDRRCSRVLIIYALSCIYTDMHMDVFEALADPTRRRVVDALRSGERQVNDLADVVGIHQSGVSRHLRILSEAGFVTMRPDGQRRLYSLAPDPFREIDQWLAQYRQLWEKRLDRFGAALEARQQQQQDVSRSDKE
ncbi:ArsR/SmtB family transcription factor [Sphingobium fuliginis]|uniref:Transcriptional regulator, ArsR family n=2 Tax=Sphingobium TaxID=165695 RepID=A0A292Z3E2_SPHSA|nr:metalloregulator ArsR/SmtB family transcription factor [Sphingobium fuliginis]GAY20632.1 transcriptional regulator, ArsR family [Sphingobium fuliginis]